MILKYFLFLASFLILMTSFSQSKSEIILKKANELYAKNYNASFDLCCQAEKINDIRFIGEVSMCKARYYITFTDYENGEIEISKAIAFYTKKKDLINLSNAYDLKSILLDRIGDTITGTRYQLKAYQISKKSGDINSQIKRLINLSNNYLDCDDLEKAIYFLNKLELLSSYFDSENRYYFFQNKGAYYIKNKEIQRGIQLYNKAYALSIKNKMIDSQATILMLLSQANREMNQLQEAEKYALLSYSVSREYNLIYEKSEALSELIIIKETIGDFESAYNYQQEFIAVEKEILNSEKLNRISAIQNRLILAEKENIINRQNNKIAKEKLKNTETELKNQKLYIFIFIILIFFVFIVFIYFRTKKLNDTIRIQKNEVEEKNKLVESQHKDITDSIRYAERIQKAILPPDSQWRKRLPQSFVFYSPKDILSGDFYWVEETEEHIFVAAADCTGHGVPGALISIVNYNLLNKAVLEKHIYDPAKILDAVNDWLTESLHQSFASSIVKDGMDVSLISLNKKTNEVLFSGAFNSIYTIQNKLLFEHKGNKFPVGAFIHEEKRNFTTTSIQLQKGDSIYLFTDGYADQFGGPKEKKFKYAQLKETFLEINTLSPKEQHSVIQNKFIDWKGNLEQVDDVLVIGIVI